MKHRIFYLDHMRAVAILMVICIHALGYGYELPPLQKEIVLFFVLPIAVPVFFFVDGFLLAFRLRETAISYHRHVKSSVYRLLVPWAIFTVGYGVLRYLFEATGVLEKHLVLGAGFKDVLLYGFMSVYAPQLYFLLSLFILRVAYPPIRKIFYDQSLLVSSVATFLCVVFYNMVDLKTIMAFGNMGNVAGQEPVLHAIYGLQFYALGMIMARLQLVWAQHKQLWITSVAFAIVVGLKFGFPGHHWWLQFFYLLFVYQLFVWYNKENVVLSFIGKNTMGIYLFHTPVILKGVTLIACAVTQIPIVAFAAIVVTDFFLSLAVSIGVSKIPYGPVLLGIPKRSLA